MSDLHFCTMFDHNYLPRGLVLYHSLMEHCKTATLHVLCLSEECYTYFDRQKFPGLTISRLAELEQFDPQLTGVKNTRRWVEYIFTMSPCWPLFVFHKSPDIHVLTSIDCDTAFFSDPTPALLHMQHTSVGIVGHRFPGRLKHLEIHGIFNVGFQSFRRDEVGIACLNWWRERCLEWCEDRVDGDRFADQKYLNAWPHLFGAKEFRHKGLNIAPWNVDTFHFSMKDGVIFVDEDRLVFMHFAHMHVLMKRWMNTGLFDYRSHMTVLLKQQVYQPYVDRLCMQSKKLECADVFGAANLRGKQASKWALRLGKEKLRHLKKYYYGMRALMAGCAIRIV